MEIIISVKIFCSNKTNLSFFLVCPQTLQNNSINNIQKVVFVEIGACIKNLRYSIFISNLTVKKNLQ